MRDGTREPRDGGHVSRGRSCVVLALIQDSRSRSKATTDRARPARCSLHPRHLHAGGSGGQVGPHETERSATDRHSLRRHALLRGGRALGDGRAASRIHWLEQPRGLRRLRGCRPARATPAVLSVAGLVVRHRAERARGLGRPRLDRSAGDRPLAVPRDRPPGDVARPRSGRRPRRRSHALEGRQRAALGRRHPPGPPAPAPGLRHHARRPRDRPSGRLRRGGGRTALVRGLRRPQGLRLLARGAPPGYDDRRCSSSRLSR
jgi:hypothetical protein